MPISNLDVISPEEIVKISSEQGESFARKDKIKTNQIRNFYSAINSIRQKVREKAKFKADEKRSLELQAEINAEIILLEPKLAYAAGRQSAVKNFYVFIKNAIDAYKKATNKDKAVDNFITLIESIVAYHKYYGGE